MGTWARLWWYLRWCVVNTHRCSELVRFVNARPQVSLHLRAVVLPCAMERLRWGCALGITLRIERRAGRVQSPVMLEDTRFQDRFGACHPELPASAGGLRTEHLSIEPAIQRSRYLFRCTIISDAPLG